MKEGNAVIAARRMPVGAEIVPNGGVNFRVWAPERRLVEVVLEPPELGKGAEQLSFALEAESEGYFSAHVAQAANGVLYRFRLDEDPMLYPDPASRFQPDGPHGPSQVVDPLRFEWHDADWQGVGSEQPGGTSAL